MIMHVLRSGGGLYEMPGVTVTSLCLQIVTAAIYTVLQQSNIINLCLLGAQLLHCAVKVHSLNGEGIFTFLPEF